MELSYRNLSRELKKRKTFALMTNDVEMYRNVAEAEMALMDHPEFEDFSSGSLED